MKSYHVCPIGVVHSPIKKKDSAPIQGRPSKIIAEIEIFSPYFKALDGLADEKYIFILSWLHLAFRDYLSGFPKNDPLRDSKGVFVIRSASRPNPIGLTLVDLISVSSNIVIVKGLELVDNTPVIDIKPFRKEIDTPGVNITG